MDNLTIYYVKYIETKKDSDYTAFYLNLKQWLYKAFYKTDIIKDNFDDRYHNALIKLLEKPTIFNPTKSNIGTFIYNVMYNSFIDDVRKSNVKKKFIQETFC